ncbi:MAG TPA: hypothetical protein PLB12_10960 [Candidatus Goldiibacteriota bacterium]|nr:hypothetical protein [Candidatus Goldiibacteriota bacterium]HPN64602.1 hypothetical protein [Candidatus Goldiibacteriota bacterium]HRQ44854.1 hypothetical protein [Candidatus Goldiibacteriota bacterium]
MKKLIMLTGVFVLLIAGAVSAHPPSGITVEYDLKTKTVEVYAAHTSKDITKHYIDDVFVSVNGVKKITQESSTQTDDKGQRVIYIIPELKNGDKITVKADCSKFGELSKDIKVK